MASRIREGWAVGVCGIEAKHTKPRSGIENNRRAETRVCDFITEYIAPGGGNGSRGAGTRMMAAVMTAIGAEGQEERGVHGHIRRGNTAGKKFWKGMGMHTTMWADKSDKGKEESRVYEVEGTKGEWGYMRNTWGTIGKDATTRLEQ